MSDGRTDGGVPRGRKFGKRQVRDWGLGLGLGLEPGASGRGRCTVEMIDGEGAGEGEDEDFAACSVVMYLG